MVIRRAGREDVKGIVALMNAEDENLVSEEQLTNWYFNNHSQSHGLIICEYEGNIEGICSTNHFRLDLNGSKKLIAFPMKVLTSSKIRGKGVFSKLYWKNEEVCFGDEKVDFFINFPNDISSPIFLKKFEYLPGICSDLALIINRPIFLGAKSKYEIVDNIPDSFFAKPIQLKQNGFTKDQKYFQWRYKTPISTESEKYKFLALRNGRGFAVVKKDKKKGIPIYLLLDLFVHGQEDVVNLFNAARHYSMKNLAMGILCFLNEYNREAIDKIKLKKILRNQFNFSVKGKSMDETKSLAKTPFNFELGDLDFL